MDRSNQSLEESSFLKALEAQANGSLTQVRESLSKLQSSDKGKEVLFLSQLEHQPFLKAPTAVALAYQLRYLWLLGKINSALDLLNNSPFESAEIDLQAARIYLDLGQRREASRKLARAVMVPAEQQIERLELLGWLSYLEQKPGKASQIRQQLEQEVLYLPPQTLPGRLESTSLKELERWMMLFSGSEVLVARATQVYFEQDKWAELSGLCQLNQSYHLPTPHRGVCYFAQEMALQSPYQKLKSQRGTKKLSLRMMQKVAIQEQRLQRWGSLFQLGVDLARSYPQLLEGLQWQKIARAHLEKASKSD